MLLLFERTSPFPQLKVMKFSVRRSSKVWCWGNFCYFVLCYRATSPVLEGWGGTKGHTYSGTFSCPTALRWRINNLSLRSLDCCKVFTEVNQKMVLSNEDSCNICHKSSRNHYALSSVSVPILTQLWAARKTELSTKLGVIRQQLLNVNFMTAQSFIKYIEHIGKKSYLWKLQLMALWGIVNNC